MFSIQRTMALQGVSIAVAVLVVLQTATANPVGISSTVSYPSEGTHRKSAAVCPVGDVVYRAGDEIPGREACERCVCAEDGKISCRRRKCEPRPGCKAVHRPDECCPTYQCECEQDGHVYANGEKLLDPKDPCKVCYCQGGEVVCRRIACFLRDDCEARAVPGRCCPEYDHCPLRGASTEPGKLPGISTSVGSALVYKKSENVVQKVEEKVKKEITIKEVTPVSEIPAVSGIRIKEIVPSPIAEVSEYPPEYTSKSHLTPREAHTESITTIAPVTSAEVKKEEFTEIPILKIGDKLFSITNGEIIQEKAGASTAATIITIDGTEGLQRGDMDEVLVETSSGTATQVVYTTSQDESPQSSITTISPEIVAPVSFPPKVTTDKPLTPEEEDTAFEMGNPAFPPIPDDFELSNHEETDVSSESNTDYSHVLNTQQIVAETENPIAKSDTDVITEKQFSKILPDVFPFIKNKSNSVNDVTQIPEEWLKSNDSITTERVLKSSSLLNLRAALPTDILNLPSAVPEIITGESDLDYENPSTTMSSDAIDVDLTSQAEETTLLNGAVVNNLPIKYISTINTEIDSAATELSTSPIVTSETTVFYGNPETVLLQKLSDSPRTNPPIKETTTNNLLLTEATSIPRDLDSATHNKMAQSMPTKMAFKINSPEDIHVNSQESYSTTPKNTYELQKTTEMSTTWLASEEGYTVEPLQSHEDIEIQNKASVIQESRNSALVKGTPNKNNVLTDLINLVGAVASIGNSTEESKIEKSTSTFSDSEELIPVYENNKKSQIKGSINSNTIQEPFTDKASTGRPNSAELKEIEITDDETDAVTDSTLPNNKVEPTTRRPIIDNVSDTPSNVKTDVKDVEIITKSYVPTLNRRPTKVVMKKNSEKAELEVTSHEFSDTTSIAPNTDSEMEADILSLSSPTAAEDSNTTITDKTDRLSTSEAYSLTTTTTISQ